MTEENGMKYSELLFYTSPASAWTQALPIGNGTLGAMIYGGVKNETLALNHDELWTGRPKDTSKKGAPAAFEKARKLALSGKFHEAQKIIEKDFESVWSQAYLPLGNLNISFGIRGKVKDYKRYLDISTSVSGVEFKAGDTVFKREYFASYPDKAICAVFTNSKPVDFSFSVSSVLRSDSFVENDTLWLEGECHGENAVDNECPNKHYYDEPKMRGSRFKAGFRLITDGKMRRDGNTVRVTDSCNSKIIFACETSFSGFDRHPYLDGKEFVPAVENRLRRFKYTDKTMAKAIEDYQSIYSRVSLDIKGKGSSLPTDRRLIEFKKKRDDTGLIELVWNYGRYLAISSSRPGSQPMNLQGIWSDRYDAPWNANYTININTEMNYWLPAMPAGHSGTAPRAGSAGTCLTSMNTRWTKNFSETPPIRL